MPNSFKPILICTQAVREKFGEISLNTVCSWLAHGNSTYDPGFPRPLMVGRKLFWQAEGLMHYIDAVEVSHE